MTLTSDLLGQQVESSAMRGNVFEQDRHCDIKYVLDVCIWRVASSVRSAATPLVDDCRHPSLRHDIPSGTGNVHEARERPCGYTRKSVFAISFPGDFLVVSVYVYVYDSTC